MTESFRHDHPTYLTRQSCQIQLPAGSADSLAGKFVAFADMKIKGITANVNVAGTNAAAAYTLLKGTDTAGTLTLGETAAGGAISNALSADIELSAGEFISFHRVATHGATMAASAQIEFVVEPRADVS